jgi:cold shock CspA family protein
MTDTKIVGRIIKVSKKGWGFISSRDIEFTRIFFHWTALRQDTVGFKELKPGLWVEFTPLQMEGKGYRAVHIRVIEKPAYVTPEQEKELDNEAEAVEGIEVSALREQ